MTSEDNSGAPTEGDGHGAAAQRAIATATAFVSEHGTPARAVAENLGRAGVRLVLIGGDGGFGDVLLADMRQATAVTEAVADLELSDWDKDTTAALTIGAEHRRRMAGPRAQS